MSPLSSGTDGSGIVDIYYTLSDMDGDSCSVSIQVSSDGGSTWDITPSASALSGSLVNVSSGRRSIQWASKTDLPGAYGDNYRVKVTADDYTDPLSMVWVFINNDPGVAGHEGFTGYISKYETTNAQYCQFLNDAKVTGDIVISGNNILGASGTNSGTDYIGVKYYVMNQSGKTYNGAVNGGAARISFNGSKFVVSAGFENHPVTYLSVNGALAFCGYYGYRLPTEWEWQAVADYDGTFNYGCGPTSNNSQANYLDSTHPHGTTPVGSYGVFGYDICDMMGNVWRNGPARNPMITNTLFFGAGVGMTNRPVVRWI